MPEKGQDTSVDYSSSGFPDGDKLKSGGPRVRQSARADPDVPRAGIPSNVGPQRDVAHALSGDGPVKHPSTLPPLPMDASPEAWDARMKKQERYYKLRAAARDPDQGDDEDDY